MLDNLYTDIGGKIKNWAKWIFIVEAIGAIITGLVFLFDYGIEDGWWALFIIIFGPIVAWVSSWILYAFGQLVEDTHAIRDKEGTTADVKARHKAEENARREAEENARREAEEKVRRETEEKAKCTDENENPDFDEQQQKQGFRIGKCQMCGWEKEVIITTIQDMFGPTQVDMCHKCFNKYHKNKNN